MIITVTNITDHSLFVEWFESGPLGAGQSFTRTMSPAEAHTIAGILKTLTDLGKISVTVVDEPALLDKVEAATVAQTTSIAPSELALTNGHILVGGIDGLAHDIAMSGDATITNTGTISVANSAVINKVLTGYSSTVGAILPTDTILQAFNKLNGNIAANAAAIASYS